jgi:hypothetical protein
MVLSSRQARVSLGLAVAFIGLAAVASRAQAAGEEDAAIRRGLDLRREGKDQEALDEFQKAYARNKSVRTLAQIGLAEQALGRWVDAEVHVGQALSDESHPWIRKNAPALKNALAEIQRHVGSLEIIGPRDAEVRVNGQLVGTLPFTKPVRLPIGVLNVELRREGYLSSTRTVSITAGVLTRESIGLQIIEPTPRQRVEVVPARAASAPPSALPASEPDATSDDAGPGEPGVDRGASGTWRRPAAWVAAAGAGLGVAAGGVALFLRSQKLRDADNLQCRIMGDLVNPVDPRNQARCVDLADSASSLGVAAVVSFSVAGALAIGSVILFVTLPPRASGAASVACAPVLTTPGAVCVLRFWPARSSADRHRNTMWPGPNIRAWQHRSAAEHSPKSWAPVHRRNRLSFDTRPTSRPDGKPGRDPAVRIVGRRWTEERSA